MQTTIYIRKENEARWATLEDKSRWVNEMLKNGVKDLRFLAEAHREAVNRSVKTPMLERVKKVPTSVDTPSIIAHPTPVINYNMDGLNTKVGLCKLHATPLDDRGRCLTKGCKYG